MHQAPQRSPDGAHRAGRHAVAAAGARGAVDAQLRDAAACRHEAQRLRIAGVAADAAFDAMPGQAARAVEARGARFRG